MYRPPASKIEFSDRFENFIDYVSNEGKEIILLGNILNDHEDAEWENFTTFVGFSHIVCDPTGNRNLEFINRSNLYKS